MPTYDYECVACGYRFTREQRITEAPVNTCPECSGAVQRLVSQGVGVVFQDGGGDKRHSCDRSTPCCGRETRCDKPPCGE